MKSTYIFFGIIVMVVIVLINDVVMFNVMNKLHKRQDAVSALPTPGAKPTTALIDSGSSQKGTVDTVQNMQNEIVKINAALARLDTQLMTRSQAIPESANADNRPALDPDSLMNELTKAKNGAQAVKIVSKLTGLGNRSVGLIVTALNSGQNQKYEGEIYIGGTYMAYPDERTALLDALASIGTPEALRAISDVMRSSKNPGELHYCIKALRDQPEFQSQVKEAVQRALTLNQDSFQRGSLIDTLASGTPESLGLIADIMRSSQNIDEINDCIRALKGQPDFQSQVQEALQRALTLNLDHNQRNALLRTLSSLGTPESLRELSDIMLSSTNSQDINYCINALKGQPNFQSQVKEAVQRVFTLDPKQMSEELWSVCSYISNTQLTEMLPTLEQWITQNPGNAVDSVVTTIKSFGEDKALPSITRLLKNPDLKKTYTLVSAMDNYSTDTKLSVFSEMLQDANITTDKKVAFLTAVLPTSNMVTVENDMILEGGVSPWFDKPDANTLAILRNTLQPLTESSDEDLKKLATTCLEQLNKKAK
jgi:hypothetical protein